MKHEPIPPAAYVVPDRDYTPPKQGYRRPGSDHSHLPSSLSRQAALEEGTMRNFATTAPERREQLVLGALRKHGPMTRAELLAALGVPASPSAQKAMSNTLARLSDNRHAITRGKGAKWQLAEVPGKTVPMRAKAPKPAPVPVEQGFADLPTGARQRKVLDALREQGPLTRKALAERLGCHEQELPNTLFALEVTGLIEAEGDAWRLVEVEPVRAKQAPAKAKAKPAADADSKPRFALTSDGCLLIWPSGGRGGEPIEMPATFTAALRQFLQATAA